MRNIYNNYSLVYRHRTYGRGLFLVNHPNRKIRRHARRFLAWYLSHHDNPEPIKTKLDGFMIVQGEYRDRGRCDDAKELICDYPVGVFKSGSFVSYNDIYCLAAHSCFQRDGIPNHYDKEANVYDRYCMSQNMKAYAIKHSKEIDWTTIYRSEIMDDQYFSGNAVNEYEKLPKYFREEHGYLYRYWLQNDYQYFCRLGIRNYHEEMKLRTVRSCNNDRGTSSKNMIQLRALGFVA